MHNYYLMTGRASREAAIAIAPDSEAYKLQDELAEDLAGLDELPFEFQLEKLTVTKKGITKSLDLSGLSVYWPEILPNSFAWPLYSEQWQISDGYVAHVIKEAIEKEPMNGINFERMAVE